MQAQPALSPDVRPSGSPRTLIGGIAATAVAALVGTWALVHRVGLSALGGALLGRGGRRIRNSAAFSVPLSAPVAVQGDSQRLRAVPVTLGARDDEPVEVDLAPAGGLRLIGQGAQSAERALLVQVLTRAAEGRCHVITAGDVLGRLLGDEWANGGLLVPGVYVASDTAEALNRLAAEIVGRTPADEDPAGGDLHQVPPIVCLIDPGEQAQRLRADLALGAKCAVGAIVVGEWLHGTILVVDGSGTVVDATGDLSDGIVGTLTDRLDEQAARDKVRALVHEATPPARTAGREPVATIIGASPPPGLIRLFGGCEVTGPSGTIRTESRDLYALLGLFAENRTQLLRRGDIEGKLWPDAQVSQDRFYNLMKDARAKLRAALDRPADNSKDVIQNVGGGRYKINSELFTCDIWQLRDLLRKVPTVGPADKYPLLTAAVDLYTGRYLEGLGHHWAQDAARRIAHEIVDGLAQLAGLETDPERALVHLEEAARIDPTDQAVCGRRMQLYGQLNRIEAVRHCFEELTQALKARGARPDTPTVQVYRRLVEAVS